MGERKYKQKTRMWRECDEPDACYILYTEDRELIRKIKRWSAYKQGKIWIMGTYHHGMDALADRTYFALQFRMPPEVADQAAKVAGLEPPAKTRKARDETPG